METKEECQPLRCFRDKEQCTCFETTPVCAYVCSSKTCKRDRLCSNQVRVCDLCKRYFCCFSGNMCLRLEPFENYWSCVPCSRNIVAGFPSYLLLQVDVAFLSHEAMTAYQELVDEFYNDNEPPPYLFGACLVALSDSDIKTICNNTEVKLKTEINKTSFSFTFKQHSVKAIRDSKLEEANNSCVTTTQPIIRKVAGLNTRTVQTLYDDLILLKKSAVMAFELLSAKKTQ